MIDPGRWPVALAAVALLVSSSHAVGQPAEEIQRMLFSIEAQSHQQWLEGNLAALDELMAKEFHFVVMNGAVETKADVVAAPYSGEGALRVTSLKVEPETLVLRGDAAIVISVLRLEATVRGQRLPPRMRILSIFTKDAGPIGWKLTARSITPILTPPG
jgi:ketosteroid isomerase-like protein